MTRSEIFKLNIRDCIHGLIVAALTGAVTCLQTLAESGTINLKTVGYAAISGACGYLIKKYFTNK